MSVKSFNPAFHRQPDIVSFSGMLEGGGAAAMTVLKGTGFTTTQSATGKHLITLADTVQQILSVQTMLGDLTDAAAVKGFTVHFVDDQTDSKSISLWIYDASQALADLSATSYLSFVIHARNTSIQR